MKKSTISWVIGGLVIALYVTNDGDLPLLVDIAAAIAFFYACALGAERD